MLDNYQFGGLLLSVISWNLGLGLGFKFGAQNEKSVPHAHSVPDHLYIGLYNMNRK